MKARVTKRMVNEKNKIPAAFITALLTILIFYLLHFQGIGVVHERDHVKVGMLCIGDESTPYSENLMRIEDDLTAEFGSRVTVTYDKNVPPDHAAEALDSLVSSGCDIIFSNGREYGEVMKQTAQKNPDVEFCQIGGTNANESPVFDNYHTFASKIHEGWYAAGCVAGLKMQKLISDGKISDDGAWIGYIGEQSDAETISAYTAFLLGARSQCPSARMRVKYTSSISGYREALKSAEGLINEGCVIISQNTDTAAPAEACEKADLLHPVFHVGCNMDMLSAAPNTSLIGMRSDWSPYICAAVSAVFKDKSIEDVVVGSTHGQDVSAGFDRGWVKMMEPNHVIAAERSDEVLNRTITGFENGSVHVFYGDYTGVSPDDPNDTLTLSTEYRECENGSAPTFHYILKDIIVIE